MRQFQIVTLCILMAATVSGCATPPYAVVKREIEMRQPINLHASHVEQAVCVTPEPSDKIKTGKNTSVKTPDGKITSGKIKIGDRLRINVWRENDLSGAYQVDDAGQISFPLIGPVALAGANVSAAQTKITEGLRGDYLLHPQVAVEILPDCACSE